ncbi:imidazolonepropionase [Formosa sediminum]|uniref:Imidazolonepropionase n=1 Tax=Formosa sediminum TaxID=2594004 RepID=A0A516GTB1_9FLAO|nr:imidazolonepropionase [Formosa sediminum]QDO94748.1 imidazolonepropionase [Formosa sediminum]
MSILITNIKQLLQTRTRGIYKISGSEMKTLPYLENAYLLIEHDTIVEYGSMKNIGGIIAEKTIDATGKIVLPAWCDSHTHLVYAGHREQEFVDRINGLTYEDIANKGGGILNSAEILAQTSEDDLYEQSVKRLHEVMKMGTGAIEIKSGYGLTLESELKILRVIKRLKHDFNILVRPTFLAAHAVPKKYKNNKTAYVDELINTTIPEIAKAQLAKYIDVYCEDGYFSLEDTDRILEAGKAHNLVPKLHVNQFNAFGGVALGVKHNARSVDHLEVMRPEDVNVLQGSDTMPVALPACSFFLGLPYTPARTIIDSGLPLALASDYNPGTTPSGNMNFVVSTACIKMKMTPEEAINAATINGAYAMGAHKMFGSITRGKKANVIITEDIPNYSYLPYAFGNNSINTVIINGIIVE